MELQLRLLDPPLDQFVEGSDVGELFNLPPSLTMQNSCLVIRRVSFVVRVVFAQGDVGLGRLRVMGLSPCVFRFSGSPLHLHLGTLECDNLSLELVIELLQCLLFTDSVITVESHLLPIMM